MSVRVDFFICPLVLVRRVKRICSSLRELFSKTILELFLKRTFFLSQCILFSETAILTINAILRRRIFFILQCFFKIFHKSIILVELVETKQNMKKVLLIFWCASGHLKLTSALMGCYKVPLSKSQNVWKTKFQEFLEYMFTYTEGAKE